MTKLSSQEGGTFFWDTVYYKHHCPTDLSISTLKIPTSVLLLSQVSAAHTAVLQTVLFIIIHNNNCNDK